VDGAGNGVDAVTAPVREADGLMPTLYEEAGIGPETTGAGTLGDEGIDPASGAAVHPAAISSALLTDVVCDQASAAWN